MRRHFTVLALFLLAMGAAGAATISTTLTVTASGPFSGTSVTITGTANLTNIGSGTFSSTFSLTSFTSTGNLAAPFTITISGNTLTGTVTIPLSILTSTSGSASGTVSITGGTGSYAGYTGSIPVTGTGSLSGTTISLNFSGSGTINTSGGGTTTPTPTITQVADAVSYTSMVAQGSVIFVKGSNLSGSGSVQAQTLPLATTLGGVKVTFTPSAGGSGTDAYMVNTYNQGATNQVVAILPSSVAPGNYNVTVTNGTAVSAPFQATVVAHKFDLNTFDGTGSGRALVQNFVSASQIDLNTFTTEAVNGVTISPAHPGQTLIAYGTGLGPITSADNVSGAVDLTKVDQVQVIVGGETITPSYWGRYGPGADQVNFALPSDVQTGCTVPLQISVNGTLSQSTWISIAPAGTSACVSPQFTTSQLQAFDNGATQTTGGFSLLQIGENLTISGTTSNVKITEIAGEFTTYTGSQLAALSASNPFTFTQGSCTVIQVSGSSQGQLVSGMGIPLDAGVLTLNGPSGSNISNQQLTELNNAYFQTLGETGLPTSVPGVGNGQLVAGTYTLTGAGGKDVGKFNASLTLGTPLTVTGGLPATVNRSAGLPIAWTGGNSTDQVEIVGYAGTTSGSGTTNAVTNATEFICITTAGQGSFTVPSSILSQLPAVSASAISTGTGSSILEVLSTPNGSNTFTAPLTAGGSVTGGFAALVGVASSPVYQ